MRISRVWCGLGLVGILTSPVAAHGTTRKSGSVSGARARFSVVDCQSPGPIGVARSSRDHRVGAWGQPVAPTTTLRIHMRTTADSAFRTVARVLAERGYSVRDGLPHALSTGDRYVAGVGMVRVQVRVLPDSLGSSVHVSGEWRRLRRLLIVSAMSKDSVVIAADARDARGAKAWQELTAIGEELGGVVRGETDLRR